MESKFTKEEFEPLDKFLLPDNDKMKEIKTIYHREIEYISFLQPIESFFAFYYYDYDPKLKDVDVKKAVRKVKSDLNKTPDFFDTEFEKELMHVISFALKKSTKKITKHELQLVLGYILWCIDNRNWVNDPRAYLNWLCNFFKIFNKEDKQKFDNFYEELGKEYGKTEEEIKLLKNEGDNPPELSVSDIALAIPDSENFFKHNERADNKNEKRKRFEEEKMIDVKCSVCMKGMQMPESFLKAGKERGVDAMKMPHICSDCTEKAGDVFGDKKMKGFIEDVNKQMDKMGKSNEIAEKLAEEITYGNIDALIAELNESDASEEDKIKEAFYRGVWMTLFLIGNNHELGFLEKEAENIRDFNEKVNMKRKK